MCCGLPAPRCRGSSHHLWQGRLGSSPRAPPQSETNGKNICSGGKTIRFGCNHPIHQKGALKLHTLRQTYDKVPGLVGAGEESRRVSVHLVLESGGGAIFCLTSQRTPELICNDEREPSTFLVWEFKKRRVYLEIWVSIVLFL